MAKKVNEIETLQDEAGRFQCPGCQFSTQLAVKMATHVGTKHPGLLGKKKVIKPAAAPESKAAEAEAAATNGGNE